MKSTSLLLVFSALLSLMACRKGLQKYYTHISPEEFASYDTVKRVVKSIYGDVYQVNNKSERGIQIDFYVFEKKEKGVRVALFKLHDMTELKNDSTFLFSNYDLKISGDTSNWKNGIWFYSDHTKIGSINYHVDSMPPKVKIPNLRNLTMGIYFYQKEKLVKLSGIQSEEEFLRIYKPRFYFLPDPGRFYLLVKFNQIN